MVELDTIYRSCSKARSLAKVQGLRRKMRLWPLTSDFAGNDAKVVGATSSGSFLVLRTFVCLASMSSRNVRWPRRMLHPGESRWACRRDRQTDRQTDGRETVTIRFPLDVARVIKGWIVSGGWQRSSSTYTAPSSIRRCDSAPFHAAAIFDYCDVRANR